MKIILKQIVLLFIIALAVFVIVDKDSFLYSQPVGLITQVKEVSQTATKDDFNNQDKQITQEVTIKILNGHEKNQETTIDNQVAQSQVTGQVYQRGQKVLLGKSNGQYNILTQKRDALVAGLITLFIGLCLIFMRRRSTIMLALSLMLNLGFFVSAVIMQVDFSSLNIILVFSLLAMIFAIVSLLFTLGKTRQMFYTLMTTLLSVGITFLIVLGILGLTGNSGIHFEYMNYVSHDPRYFFYVGAIISVLGAIMDGTGDIVAGMFGVHRQNQVQHYVMIEKEYFKSGLSIGQEIIGTLINVLFMIFMAETFPIAILLLRNNNNWSYIGTIALNLGLLQTLISAIGIVIAIPVTAGFVSIMFGKSKKEVV